MRQDEAILSKALQTVEEAGRRPKSERQLDQLLDEMAKLVRERLGFYAVIIALYDRSKKRLINRKTECADADSKADLSACKALVGTSVEGGIISAAARSGAPVLVPDVHADPRYIAIDVLPRVQGELAVPLCADGEVVGVLDVLENGTGEIEEERVQLVETLASALAAAVRNATLFVESQRLARQLKLVGEVGRIATSDPNLARVLPAVVSTVSEAFGYASVAISFVDEVRDEVVLTARYPESDNGLQHGHRQPVGVGVSGQVARSGEPIVLDDVRQEDNYIPLDDGYLSELCVPLTYRGRVLGVLAFESQEVCAFDHADLDLAQTLAEQIVGAMANARSFEEIKALDQWRSDMMAILVHDLRSPLFATAASLDVLADPRGGDLSDLQRRQLTTARGALRSLADMVDGILDTHRLEEGHLALRIGPVVTADVVEKAIASLSHLAEVHDVTIATELDPDLGPLRADADLSARVFANLLSNAIKFVPSRSTVTVRGSATHGAYAEFRVIDQGEGIPEEDLERIFDKFAQVESRQGGRKYSSGLGLAFCREAVGAQGGEIRVESVLGEGSTFIFTLPLSTP